jgi:hypothetical protein
MNDPDKPQPEGKWTHLPFLDGPAEGDEIELPPCIKYPPSLQYNLLDEKGRWVGRLTYELALFSYEKGGMIQVGYSLRKGYKPRRKK